MGWVSVRFWCVWLARHMGAAGLFLVMLLGVAAIGGWMFQTSARALERQHHPPGRLVPVDGEWIHLDCRGPRTAPVMVLDAGVMGWSQVWGWFLQDAQPRYRVCAWDRPGLGWSAPTERPADAASSMRVLHDLLEREGLLQHPIVLVGHSLGGLNVMVYTALFPHDVRFLVLLDPAHPQQLQRLPLSTVEKTFDQVHLLERTLPLFDFGAARGVMAARTSSALYLLPEEVRSDVLSIATSHPHIARAVLEYRAFPQSAREAMALTHVDGPLLVVSSSDREQGNRAADRAWWALHQGLAGLSPWGVWEVVPETSHQTLVMKRAAADAVLDQIARMDAATTLTPPP